MKNKRNLLKNVGRAGLIALAFGACSLKEATPETVIRGLSLGNGYGVEDERAKTQLELTAGIFAGTVDVQKRTANGVTRILLKALHLLVIEIQSYMIRYVL